MKRCCTCKVEKTLDCFGVSKQKKDGLKPNCKPCHNKGNAKSRAKNPQASRESSSNWQRNNREKAREKLIRWKILNPEKMRAYSKAHRDKDITATRKKLKEWRMSRPEIRINRTIGQRIRALIGGKQGVKTSELVGYSSKELVSHLERQFSKGMDWSNYGEWHIDHIVPLVSFKVSSLDDPQIRRAWALSNLRPLWAIENKIKHAKVTHLI